MPYTMGGNYTEQADTQPSSPAPEPPLQGGEPERGLPAGRPGGGFMIGGNGGYALGSGN